MIKAHNPLFFFQHPILVSLVLVFFFLAIRVLE